jgi:capsular exopolysaccharide synthesis family protein
MNRIKQAIDRAKAERGTRPTSPMGIVGMDRGAPDGSHSGYQETEVVPVTRDTFAKERVVSALDDMVVSRAYKVLRTQVLQRMQMNNWSTLAVSSASEGEGKSLTLANLAVSLARGFTHTVLLVDLDLHRPSIHRHFGCRAEPGVSDCLLTDLPLEEVLINPGIDRLVVLPAGAQQPNSSDLLGSPRMSELVAELKSRYPRRLVLFDLPPVLVGDDAMAFLPNVDCTLLVIKDGKIPPKDLKKAAELLGRSNLLGTVLNNTREVQPKYYY